MATRWAILSDIHGNLEALEAVLRDAEARGAEAIAVLGDTIDYGPDPVACLTRAEAVAEVFLVGNHEEEAVTPSEYQEESAVLDWSLAIMKDCGVWQELETRIRDQGAPALASRVIEPMHLVHASAGRPTVQYIWPAHDVQYLVYNHHIDDRLTTFLSEFRAPHGFNGHTHVPAILTHYAHRDIFDPYRGCRYHHKYTFIGPNAVFFVPHGPCVIRGLENKAVVINVGSVGQPRRLGDNRASYVLYDGHTMEFRRVEYAWQKTRAKLAELPIPDEERTFLEKRLATGI